jgi:dephospho-CoA kinase
MIVIGITGPSGSGKGFVSNIMAKYGLHIIDADAVYHKVITPPSECLDELADHYGSHILKCDGTLDRTLLSDIVFGENNKSELEKLNEITHKYVVESILKRVQELQEQNAVACVIDAPLLIEAGLQKRCNFTLAVLADRDTRIERISLRDGIDVQAASKRTESQKSDSFYVENTDNVLYNNGNDATIEMQIIKLFEKWGVRI